MNTDDQVIQTLREAVRQSPDNVPLRQHFAEVLLGHGLLSPAECEFREALKRAPANLDVRIGLAKACHQLGKHSEALVIVEDLMARFDPPAAAYVLQARLLLATGGNQEEATTRYLTGVKADPGLTDRELEERLGLAMAMEQRDEEVVNGRVRLGGDDSALSTGMGMERPRITFQDVGGMEKLKEEIRLKIIHPLSHTEIYQAYGKPIGGGILMYGPPGCGKTLLARATAGEVKAGFIVVGINDVVEMWLGQSERNLHGLFDLARRNKPCVLFFDEVDALGASRTDMRQSAGRQIINQFLAELDGVKSSNEGLLILAATNAPWHLDNAFRRPGRFDRIIFVPPPDEPARAGILRVLLRGKPIENIDCEHIAHKLEQFSGADLKAVVDVAIERKLAEAMKTGTPKPLMAKDLLDAGRQVRPSTAEWFATARNYALYANQAGLYDEIVEYLKLK